MTTAVQRRRGTNTEHATFTGLDGEITVNTTTYTLHVHDGATVGGIVLAKADGSNIVTSSIDINGGTIDGTVIGGSSAAAGTFTSITGTSANINGTVTADGLTVENAGSYAKAVIKSTTTAGGQTQYLNGSTGTAGFFVGLLGDTSGNGTLYHQDAKDILVYTNGIRRAIFGSGGDISFYEDTGTTAKFFWDASAEALGIGTTSPSVALDVTGTINATTGLALTGNAAQVTTTYAGNTTSRFYTSTSGLNLTVDGAWPLMFSNNSTERMRIDSSGNVGIGTTSPSSYVSAGISNVSSTTSPWYHSSYDSKHLYMGVNSSFSVPSIESSTDLRFCTKAGYTESMRIDSSGNVGIGTTPTYRLDVNAPATVGLRLRDSTASSSELNLGIGTITAGRPFIGTNTSSNPLEIGTRANVDTIFYTNSAERMRIDSSGNLLIGTSTAGASKLVVNDDSIQVNTAKTPASASDTGTTGEIAWDANYVYVCVATNTWKRSALSTW